MSKARVPLRVASMPATFVESDGTAAEMEFSDASGRRVRLRFSAELLDRLMGGVAELAANLAMRNATSTGRLEVRAKEAVGFLAEPAQGQDKIVLSLRADTGLIYHFALPPGLARELPPKLEDALRSITERPRAST